MYMCTIIIDDGRDQNDSLIGMQSIAMVFSCLL